MKQKTYILLGPPGSGKSTEAKILHKTLGLTHIEVGSELRRVATEDSDLGKLVHEIIYEKKELVPDGIIGKVLDRALDRATTGILLDGAPRRTSQIDEVIEILAEHERKIEKLIYLHLSLEECVERISKRFLCQNCKQAYKQGVDQDVETKLCSKCGGPVAQRDDDTPEGVAKRYQVFQEETVPVIEHFKNEGLVVEVSALGDPEVIAQEIMKAIGE
jgi:adenylate kinase